MIGTAVDLIGLVQPRRSRSITCIRYTLSELMSRAGFNVVLDDGILSSVLVCGLQHDPEKVRGLFQFTWHCPSASQQLTITLGCISVTFMHHLRNKRGILLT